MQPDEGRKTISLRLPPELLGEVDELVRRSGMRSRTELVERAVTAFVEEVKEAKVVKVRPYTDAEAGSAILRYLDERPATYVSDIAEALAMDLDQAFRVVASLAEEGELID